MSARTATCSCGALAATCAEEPLRVSICHCLACQQRTGAPFGVQARFAESAVTATGPTVTWTRVGDAGGQATFRRCPTCGSTVWWTIDALPGFVIVAVGAFADAAFPPPTASVYEDRRHPAWAVPDSVTDRWA